MRTAGSGWHCYSMAKMLPVPARAEMKALAHAALAHAQQQLDRAQLLLGNRDWPGAYAIATLAFEEVGKAVLCTIGMGMPAQFQVNDWFWQAFNNHEPKITIARFVLTLFTSAGTRSQPFDQAIEDLGVMASADHRTKMRALYVGYQDGSVLQPADVGQQDALRMIDNVRGCLDVLVLFNNDTEFAGEMEAFMASVANAIEKLIDSPDIDGLALMQGIWDAAHDAGPPKPPWELIPGLILPPDRGASAD